MYHTVHLKQTIHFFHFHFYILSQSTPKQWFYKEYTLHCTFKYYWTHNSWGSSSVTMHKLHLTSQFTCGRKFCFKALNYPTLQVATVINSKQAFCEMKFSNSHIYVCSWTSPGGYVSSFCFLLAFLSLKEHLDPQLQKIHLSSLTKLVLNTFELETYTKKFTELLRIRRNSVMVAK